MKIAKAYKIVCRCLMAAGLIWLSSMKVFPQLPPPEMFDEPRFTVGDSNMIFCKSYQRELPDTAWYKFKWWPVGDTTARDTTAWLKNDTSAVAETLNCGQPYLYQVRVWCRGYGTSDWSDSVFSTQDCSSPETWIDPLPEWACSSFYVYFTASDSAGIDSVHLFYRQCEDTAWNTLDSLGINYWDSCPVAVDSSILFPGNLVLNGCYELFLGAKDCAKAPDWETTDIRRLGNAHWPDIPDSVQATIKIDTQDPFSKVICDSLRDTSTVTSFKVWFTARDSVYPSGLDTVWLYAIYESDTIPVCTLASFPDSSAIDTFCTFKADSDEGWYYFYTIAKDKAGNRQSVASDICSTYVKIGITIVYFEMCDLEDTTDCTYTNGYTVQTDLKFRGDPTHTYKVHFYSDSTFCGDPDSSYHRWPGSQYPSYADTMWASDSIPLPDSLEGVKRVWCQVEDVTAGNDTVILSKCRYDSIVFDMTGPTIGRLQLIDPTPDTLICDSDTIVFPFLGWTNETLVWARLIGLRDNLSHIDSLRFNCPGTRDSTFDFDCSSVFVCDEDTMVKIPLTDGEEFKEVCCVSLDSAENWGERVHDSIRLDTSINPIVIDLYSLTCNPEFTDTFTVEVIFEGGDDDLVKAIIWDESDSVHTVKCEGYKDTVLFDLNPTGIGWHHVWATVWDSAGNNSKTVDSICYWSYPNIVHEPQYSPGTTNTICWYEVAFIDYFDAQCLDRLCENIVTDTVIADTCVTFTNLEDGTTYCYRVRGIIAIDSDTIYTHWSNTVSSTQDATPPDLDSVFIPEAGLVAGKKWVYNRDVHIQILAKDSPPGKIFGYAITENGEETKRDSFTPDSVIEETISHHLRSEEKTPIEIGIFVWDCDVKRKSNLSNTLFETIYLEEIADEIAIFPNPFNPREKKAVIRLQKTIHARAKIYDVFGNSVRTLRKDRGTHDFVWDGRNDNGDMVANGGYICVVGRHKIKVAVKK